MRRRTIFIFKNHKKELVLGVDSVALRHIMVYVWETLVLLSVTHSFWYCAAIFGFGCIKGFPRVSSQG